MPSLIAPPLSTDSSDFSNRGDSFTAALAVFNAAAKQESSDALQVLLGDTFYGAALPLYTSSSSTSNTIGYGNLSFTVSTNELFVPDMRIRAVSGANWVSGTVTSYVIGTGALVMKVLTFSGSGTFTSWTIQPEFRRVPGALTTVASAATVDLSYASDKAIDLTGSTTVTAFTVAKGQVVYLVAQGAILLTHNSASLRLPASLSYTTCVGDILKVCETDGQVSVAIYPKGGVNVPGKTVKTIFGYGASGGFISLTNLVSSLGTVSADVTGVGTGRQNLAAASYGGDRAIFGFGDNGPPLAMTNLVANVGVVAADVTGVGSSRGFLAAASYGGDKAIFGFGNTGSLSNETNLVSNVGVVATGVTGVGTARYALAAAGFGGNRAIFGYGNTGSVVSMTNLVSNTGIVSADTTGVGTSSNALAATSYGVDKAIFGYGGSGSAVNTTNLVSNVGVVTGDVTGVGTARSLLAAAGYGSDKAIFAYGLNSGSSDVSMSNLVSNIGVVSTDTTGVGTVRRALAAAGYSQ